MDNNHNNYVTLQLKAIQAWKARAPRLLEWAMSPIIEAAAKLFEQFVSHDAVELILNGMDWLGAQTLPDLDHDPDRPLDQIDRDAADVQNWAIGCAAVEGGAAGFVGLFAAPIDVPVLLTLALRTIRRVGLCYGYKGDDEIERAFVLQVLGAASANSALQKNAALLELRQIQIMLLKKSWKEIAAVAAGQVAGKELAVTTVRNLANQVGINITKRVALASIPIIGMALGAWANAWFIGDIGVSAQRAYQERWLKDRGLWIEYDAE